jgi:hypothetical protein
LLAPKKVKSFFFFIVKNCIFHPSLMARSQKWIFVN